MTERHGTDETTIEREARVIAERYNLPLSIILQYGMFALHKEYYSEDEAIKYMNQQARWLAKRRAQQNEQPA